MEQGCCSYGAHFVDEDDVANVVRHFVRLGPRHMQFYDEAVAEGFLDSGAEDDGTPATVTRLADDACIFLNRPGFAQGAGCALHVAALEAGERPMDWKPNVCWQVPLRLEHSTDENGHVTSRLRDWKQRDWGVGSDDFHWWCTEATGRLRRRPAGVPLGARRDRRPGRRGGLRPHGAAAGTGRLDGSADPDQALSAAARPLESVVVVGVVVELDAVLLGEGCVLVVLGVLARRRALATTITEPQIERSGTGLLQLARFLEAAMTTLLHAGLPN